MSIVILMPLFAGVVLLLNTGTSWAGIGLIAIALVAYLFFRNPAKNRMRYGFIPGAGSGAQRQGAEAGFDWSMKEVGPGATKQGMPGVEGDMFNLPLPMGDLDGMLDFRHRTKIR